MYEWPWRIQCLLRLKGVSWDYESTHGQLQCVLRNMDQSTCKNANHMYGLRFWPPESWEPFPPTSVSNPLESVNKTYSAIYSVMWVHTRVMTWWNREYWHYDTPPQFLPESPPIRVWWRREGYWTWLYRNTGSAWNWAAFSTLWQQILTGSCETSAIFLRYSDTFNSVIGVSSSYDSGVRYRTEPAIVSVAHINGTRLWIVKPFNKLDAIDVVSTLITRRE